MRPKVLIIGSGGVGVILTYGLEYGKKADVTLVIRSDYEKVMSYGYKIESVDYGEILEYRPEHVAGEINDAIRYGPFDFIVVATKNIPENDPVERMVEAVTKEAYSTIVLIQNGIDIEKGLISSFPKNVILSGVSTIGSTNYGGTIVHSNHESIQIGYFNNKNLDRNAQKKKALDFIELYNNDRNDCSYDPDVQSSRWKKLVYNASFNPLCAILGIDRTSLRLYGGDTILVNQAMDDIYAVAESEGVILDERIKDQMLEIGSDLWYKPSMLVDLENGRTMEVEVILGNVCRIAKKNNVSVPTLSILYEIMKVTSKKILDKKKPGTLRGEQK